MSLIQWNIIHGLFILAGLIVYHLTGSWWPVLIIAALSVFLLWSTQWYTISHLKPAGGYGNLVTLIRYLLVICITATSAGRPLRTTGLLFIIPVALDGLDGFLARRMDQVSKFGALFDPETDSLFVAMAGIIVYRGHLAGVWLLPAAYMRYIYILLLTLLRLHGIPEKRTRFGPAVAVIMFLSLIAQLVFPSLTSRIFLMVASVMVVISFGYSFTTLLSQREPE
jgi:phosphatidylglycerophosphate synthase